MGYNFRQRIARFFYGRYGADNLYNALFVTELILLFVSTVLNVLGYVEPIFAIISIALYVLSFGIVVWAMFRFFSRNIPARRRENEAWLRLKSKLGRKSSPRRAKPRKTVLPADTPDHVFRSCPHCLATLRLPRRVGKHEARCPRCDGRFTVKVKK